MRWVPAAAYAVALVPLVVASYAAAGAAFALYGRAPASIQRSGWVAHALNDVAPALAGVGCAVILIAILVRARLFLATGRGFAVRTMPWYLLATGIGAVVLRERGSGDFGLWSQVITWPLAALVGGLATDAFWTWRQASAPPAV